MSSFDELERALQRVAQRKVPTKSAILVVDDDDAVRRAMEFVLRAEFELVMCSSGEEVFATERDVMCAVIDIKMRGLSGFDVASELRRRGAGIPVIFHSAYQSERSLDEVAREYEPFAYVTKDGDLTTLRQVIRRAAAHYRIRAAARGASRTTSEALATVNRIIRGSGESR